MLRGRRLRAAFVKLYRTTPTTNNGDAFEADNAVNHYKGSASSPGIKELNTEILDKAWAEDNTVFNDIDAVVIFYGGGVFTGGSAVAVLTQLRQLMRAKKKFEAAHFVVLLIVSSSSLKTPCSENLPY